MKLKKLTIHNLASIADAEIDFDAEPLKDAPLFLLCGETGAGKTTVLDGICLALYGQTPRYDEGRVRNATEVGEFAFNDPRQLVRRGSDGARVTLMLLGNDGVNYEATWAVETIQRGANKGHLRSEDWQWKNLTTGSVTRLKSECQDCVRRAVGLDFTQFTRTTMLAQGQFTKFMLCDDAEKAEILEKLTDTSRFSLLGQRIASIYSEKDQRVKNLDIEIQHQGGLGEARAEIEQSLVQKKDAARAKNAEVQSAQARLHWEQQRVANERSCAAATRQLAAAQAAVGTEDFCRKACTVADWDLSQSVHESVRAYAAADEQQAETEQKLKAARAGVADLRGALAFEKDAQAQVQMEISQVNAELRAESVKEPVYAQASVIANDLQDAAKRGDEAAKTADLLRQKEACLPAVRAHAADAEQKLKTAQETFAVKTVAVQTAEQELEALDLPSVQARLQDRTRRQGALDNLAQRLQTQTATDERAARATQNLATTRAELQQKQAACEPLADVVASAQKARDAARQTYEHQNGLLEAGLDKVLAHLHVGDTCPICGNRIATLDAANAFAPLLDELKKTSDAAQATYEQRQHELDALNASIKEMQKSVAQSETEVAALEVERTRLVNEIRAAVRAVGLTDPTPASVAAARAETQEQVKTDEARWSDGQAKAHALANLRKEAERAAKTVEACRQAYQQSLDAVKAAEDTVKALTQERDSATAARDEKLVAVDARLLSVCPNWRADWERAGVAFAKGLCAAADAYRAKQERGTKLAEDLQRRAEEVQKVEQVLTGIWTRLPDWREDEPGRVVAGTDLSGRVTRLDTTIVHLCEERAAAAQMRAKHTQICEQFLAAQNGWTREHLLELVRLNVVPLRQEVDAGRTRVKEAASAQTAVRKTAQEHLALRPANWDEAATEGSLKAAADTVQKELNDLNQVIGGLENQLKEDDACAVRRRQFEAERQTAEAERQQWEPLNRAFGDREGKRIRLVIQSYVLRNVLEQANRYLKQLSDRYELACVGLTLTVKDGYEGGVERPAKTLSGGESFLVSLALALGLAAMNTSGLSVDMLFIDEGFGTLSGEHLDAAVDTLERLNAVTGSRKVGVISHVERLRERITTHIEVTRRGYDPSRVTIVG